MREPCPSTYSSHIPELKHLASPEREEVVEPAVFSLPTALRCLLTLSGVVLPTAGVALALSPTLGRWVAYAYLPIG